MKGEGEGKPEEGRGGQEGGSRTGNGSERGGRIERSHFRDWRGERYSSRGTKKENGLVFWAYKKWEYFFLRFFSLFIMVYWYYF